MDSNVLDCMIDLKDWCETVGISRQRACALCREGRIEGAQFVLGYKWMVPAGTVKPERKINRWIAERHAEAQRVADEERERESLRHVGLTDEERGILSRAVADGWAFNERGNATRAANGDGKIWPAPAFWCADAWAFVQSIKNAE